MRSREGGRGEEARRRLLGAVLAAKRRAGRVYRPLHRHLSHRVLERGFVASTDAAPDDWHFDRDEEGNRYEPSSRLWLSRILRSYEIGSDDVFIDYGSGKGRVVYQAARRPFGRVLGVDLSESATEMARANIDGRRHRLRCQDVVLVSDDATTWPLPDDVNFVYLYNPFEGEIFQAALDRIVDSLDRRPRRMRFIYAFPTERARVLATGRFRLAPACRSRARSGPASTTCCGGCSGSSRPTGTTGRTRTRSR